MRLLRALCVVVLVVVGFAAVGGSGVLQAAPPSAAAPAKAVPPTAAAKEPTSAGSEKAPPSATGHIPAHNRADQREPPPRPDPGSAERRARLLFDAILKDDPALAADVFFPRAAFLLVKDIKDPGRYYDQLYARFLVDIHALHRKLAANARFERFELARRGGFVGVREEGNRLPYWASRHSVLHYQSTAGAQQLEVRVLITWDDQWYVIHLSEFH